MHQGKHSHLLSIALHWSRSLKETTSQPHILDQHIKCVFKDIVYFDTVMRPWETQDSRCHPHFTHSRRDMNTGWEAHIRIQVEEDLTRSWSPACFTSAQKCEKRNLLLWEASQPSWLRKMKQETETKWIQEKVALWDCTGLWVNIVIVPQYMLQKTLQ
jgi:hypothetical protein